MSKLRRGKRIAFFDIDVDGAQTGVIQKVNFDSFNDEDVYTVRVESGREFEVRNSSIVMVFP